jgi:hypothetical protein
MQRRVFSETRDAPQSPNHIPTTPELIFFVSFIHFIYYIVIPATISDADKIFQLGVLAVAIKASLVAYSLPFDLSSLSESLLYDALRTTMHDHTFDKNELIT